MRDRLRVGARPSSLAIAGVFRVCHVAKRSRLQGGIGFTLILAARDKRYVAIAGQSGSQVSVGDLARVRGCILRRMGRPVLVISSLDRMADSGALAQRRRLVPVDLEGPQGGKWR